MWYALHLVLRDFICDHREPFVQLHGISIDNLAIKTTSYFYSQLSVVIRIVDFNFFTKSYSYIRFACSRSSDDSHEGLGRRSHSHSCGCAVFQSTNHTVSRTLRTPSKHQILQTANPFLNKVQIT